jgi:drug/metabolite transporter (DMT)-like permease
MVLWGIYFGFLKIPIDHFGALWPPLLDAIFFFPIFFVYTWLKKEKLVFNIGKKDVLIPLLGNGVLLSIAAIAYSVSISKGYISIAVPLVGSYPTLFVVLAFFIFKEKLSKSQVAGIVLAMLGIVTLSFNSV